MYEVEYKVELTKEEKDKLVEVLNERKFPFLKQTHQNDFYVHAVKSPYGCYDLKRYRDEDGAYIYTEKMWELVEGEPFRREDEHEVSKEVFETEIAKYPDAIKIKKDREWFSAVYEDTTISVTIDSVKFDHSENIRYFLEAELISGDKAKVKELKELIIRFLKDVLGKQEIPESPYGMFSLAFEKK